MPKTEFAYIKRYKSKTYCIMYQLGRYAVAEMHKKDTGVLCVALRTYKTISGAERFLLSLSSVCDSATKPEILYGTEQFIKEGSYLKGEK